MTSSFPLAGPPEILRSSQKDSLYSERLASDISDLVLGIVGPRYWLRSKPWVDSTARLLYHGLTTLFNYQTLGEEYCGIVQVDPSGNRLPSRFRRLVMISLYCYGPLGAETLLKAMEKFVDRNDSGVREEAKTVILKCLAALRQVLSVAQRLNTGVFYLHGVFYHLSKRISGVRYATLKQWAPAESQQDSTFKILGFVNLLNLSLSILYTLYKARHSSASMQGAKSVHSDKDSVLSGEKCVLCLDYMKDSACTPCGHVFCWVCIHECLLSRQECPLCREKFKPSRVVPMVNYG